MKKAKEPLEKFVAIVRRLRKDCPWDREQTHKSIRHGLIEETYEVIDAIDQNNADELKKELGDLLLHIVLHAVPGRRREIVHPCRRYRFHLRENDPAASACLWRCNGKRFA